MSRDNNVKGVRVMDKTKLSKLLSIILRHKPEAVGVTLDKSGWVDIDVLLKALNANGKKVSREQLQEVVDTNNKKRFAIEDNKIRASQGHSIDVDLGYEEATPPDILYHGTVQKFMDSIFEKGLIKGERHQVHLSKDTETATKVGSRRGKPVLLEVLAGDMHKDGFKFNVSANGVWLTEHVPVQYIRRK